MKMSVLSLLFLVSTAYATTVVDSLYDSSSSTFFQKRDPASQSKFCLVSEDLKTFAGACYSSMDLCTKRQDFWKDLPGVKYHSCIKF